MERFGNEGRRRKKCPLCGGKIEISYLYQYSHDYEITKSGRISGRYKKRDCGSMEVGVAMCKCGANWGDGEFSIDMYGHFIDYKYEGEGR